MAQRRSINHPILRAGKATQPPIDPVNGPSERPVLVRVVRIRRSAYSERVKARHSQSSFDRWVSLEITIPREIAEVAGLEAGATMCLEAYSDGRVRLYAAGDLMSREDKMI